jgi:hypothetical protein
VVHQTIEPIIITPTSTTKQTKKQTNKQTNKQTTTTYQRTNKGQTLSRKATTSVVCATMAAACSRSIASINSCQTANVVEIRKNNNIIIYITKRLMIIFIMITNPIDVGNDVAGRNVASSPADNLST